MVRKRPAQATFLKLLRQLHKRSWPGASKLVLASILQTSTSLVLETFGVFQASASQVSLCPSVSLSLSVCLSLSLSLTHTHTPSTKAGLQKTPDACINHNCTSASSHVTA